MPTSVIKEADIKYLSKDFQGFKRDLMQYAQVHFSGVFSDYNESSPGMMLIELQAYIGDVLSYYLDQQFNEMRMQTAQQAKNVQLLAKSKGYRPRGPSASSVTQAFFIEVPAILDQVTGNYTYDSTYCPQMIASTSGQPSVRVIGPNGSYFETYDIVDFSTGTIDSPLSAVVLKRDPNSSNPLSFALRKSTTLTAGKTVSDTVTVNGFTPFYRLVLSQQNVIEVVSVTDGDGNTWYETDFLSQDTVIVPVANANADSDVVPYVVKLLTVPRRFTIDTDITSGQTSLQFGSGDGISYDDEIVPNISDMALPIPGRGYYNNFVLDPQNFLKTTSLGMSPRNTTLYVNYRVGGGSGSNVPVGTINAVDSFTYSFATLGLDPAKSSAVISSLETTNTTKADGGAPAESIAEVKANSDAYFAAQGRAVTREDYMTHILAMPSKFGRPEKVYIARDIDPLSLDIHLLAKDSNNNLTLATSTLKSNISLYLKKLRMLTDGVNILDGQIINFGVSFGVVVGSRYNRTEVLGQCLQAIKDYFDVDQMQIGQPIVHSDVEATLQSVNGVVSVYNLTFRNIFGTSNGLVYSTTRYDFSASINGIIYCPQDSIFEIKNPNVDIVGETR